MKKFITSTAIIGALLLSINVSAQAPPPPPPDHGSSGNQNGGNAPVGSGLFILLGLGVVYGGKKIYDKRKEGLE